MAKKTKTRLAIIDGHALMYQAFHAIPPLTTKKGEQVNAVYGFAAILFRVIRELKPQYLMVAFDVEGETFRDAISADYKSTREKMPDDMFEQIPRVRELVEALNIPILEQKGFEADDIIGTIAKRHLADETVIVTSDMDAFQLIDPKITIFKARRHPTESSVMDGKAFIEKYGFKPEQVIDYKALKGDSSDNIPGVKGIGDKTATELLAAFGTVEKMYDALEKKSKKFASFPERVQRLLLDSKKDAFESYKLATIITDMKIDFTLQDAELAEYDRAKVVSLLQELEFRSLVGQLPGSNGDAAAIAATPRAKPGTGTHNYILVDDDATFQKMYGELMKQKVVAIDTETDSLETIDADLIGISLAWKAGEAYFVHVRKHPNWLKLLQAFFENERIQKVGHNLKFDIKVLYGYCSSMKGVAFDTMVASYLLNPGSRSHKLDTLVFGEFGYEMQPIEDLIGKKGKDQLTMLDVPLEKVGPYAAEDADYTFRLYQKFAPQLEEKGLMKLFHEIEMPLILVLAHMERNGVDVDVTFLKKLSAKHTKRLKAIEQDIYTAAGVEFNINSPSQLQEVLFQKMQIPISGLGHTKTGISTRASELEKLQGKHPIIDMIMEFRELSKLVSTYLDALPELVHKRTKRIHTSYNQVVAATGRLSSQNPNLQNIPVRTELGREIRNAFIAPQGMRLLSCDYSQIELRLAAAVSQDAAMLESFKKGEDIHAATAARVWNVPLDEVTKEQRYAAKAVNFGVLYGQGMFGLAKGAGIPLNEARDFIEQYFAVYTGLAKWLEDAKRFAKRNKYAETLFGRRRPLPEIDSSNGMLRSAAERMAVNMPLQGTAADLMKKAMVDVYAELHNVSQKARMILQVHDELVLEVPEGDVKKVAAFVEEKMEKAMKLPVPIIVDAEVGKNWGEMSPL
ncbi:MAG: DNA polymerase I [Patescibacteria group bacterium]|jgi:DNA polymerase-1